MSDFTFCNKFINKSDYLKNKCFTQAPEKLDGKILNHFNDVTNTEDRCKIRLSTNYPDDYKLYQIDFYDQNQNISFYGIPVRIYNIDYLKD